MSSREIDTLETVLALLLKDEAFFLSDELRGARVLMAQLVDKLRDGMKKAPIQRPAEMRPSLPSSAGSICQIKPAQFSRLVYANPVCLLSSCQGQEQNLMTISWLTAVDNNGHLVLSVNKRRQSAVSILSAGTFVLNVPTAQLAKTVLEIGGCSGRDVDKIERFRADLGGYCLPGWRPLEMWPPSQENRDAGDHVFAISGCVAHLVIQVLANLSDLSEIPQLSSHHLFVCKVCRAFVHSTYWDGKIFAPRPNMEVATPPYMSFFGSQTFGYVVPSLPSQAEA